MNSADTQTPAAKIDADLRNVYFVPCQMGPQKRIACGEIFGDHRRRWPDGTDVYTSYIVSGPDADGVIRTRNSVYRIASYCAGAGPDDFLDGPSDGDGPR